MIVETDFGGTILEGKYVKGHLDGVFQMICADTGETVNVHGDLAGDIDLDDEDNAAYERWLEEIEGR